MNQHTATSRSKGSLLGRLARFFLKALGAVLALIVLAIVAFNIYLSTRSAPRTVRPAGTIKVPAPFHVGRSFIDYMSIERFHSPTHAVHQALLRKNIVILEGLDLRAVSGGEYFLVCAPLPVVGADGAPARVYLLDEAL